MIRYAGTQTTKMDFDALMANMPEGMALDSSMIEMILAQMPEEGFSNPMNWEAWFSGKTVLTKMIVPDFMQNMGGGGAAGITPFSGGSGGATDMSNETYFNYEDGSMVQALPSFMAEPYIVTSELEQLDWEVMDQDSIILGYSVRQATASTDTMRAVAWYAPELASPAGPMTFGGLPGAILHLISDAEAQGASIRIEFSADSISTELDRPVAPPTGTPISQEDYSAIMMQRMQMMMQQGQQQ